MHYAKIERSPRLQRVLRVLKIHNEGLTTMQIIEMAKVCAVNSIVSELRMNGYQITCKNIGGAYLYRLDLQASKSPKLRLVM